MRLGPLRLLAVERVVIEGGGNRAATWLVARKDPWLLVIQDGAKVRALGLDGLPIPLEEVRRRVPGLDDLLAGPPSGVAPGPPVL